MFLYITLGTNDLAAATRFYDAVMPCPGLERRFQNDDEVGYGPPRPSGSVSGSPRPITASRLLSPMGRCRR
jgi:catechol 2,3-dioxygenase-like lactoylglutathione lyase family enzyme